MGLGILLFHSIFVGFPVLDFEIDFAVCHVISEFQDKIGLHGGALVCVSARDPSFDVGGFSLTRTAQ